VVVYCESIDSGVTLSAKGGAGSGGGNGTVGSIGANGAGGGGGVLIAAVPASYTGTSTAAGGDKGGTGAEDGGAGYKRILQKDAA